MNYVTDINTLDAAKVSTLIDAALQAYNAFNDKDPTTCQCHAIVPPKYFEHVACWSGIDAIFSHDKSEEIFGVVFRTKVAPYKYIFSFRGTASILDGLDDLGAEKSSFKPFDSATTVPAELQVEAGFYDIYTEQTSSVEAMQTQVFKLLDKYQNSDKPIDELWITGHSLGSSLCELFSLDVALSRPEINATNINFACPRTGNQAFVDFFVDTLGPQNTLRVQNTYDKVPCVPLEDMGYAHLPWALLVAFYEEGIVEQYNLLARHSALNYQAAVNCAKAASNGMCVDSSLCVPLNKYNIVSEAPSTSDVCGLF